MPRHEQAFRRPVVAIAQTRLGIARGPAFRLEVVHEQELGRADGAHGVSPIVRPSQVVPFLADEHHIARRIHPARLRGRQEAGQAVAAHLRMRLLARQLEKRRSQVAEIDEVIDHAARRDVAGPAHGERHMEPVLEDLPFHSRKRHAVVGRHDDERPIELAGGFQHGERPTELFVHPFDFHRIVEQVPPDHVCVRKIGRNDDVLDPLARADAGIALIRTVRLVRADPEAERLAGPALFQKILEIRSQVAGPEVLQRRAEGAAVELGAGRIVVEAAALPVSRRPALAGAADVIAGLCEEVGIDGVLRREPAIVAARVFQLPRVAAGEDGRPARAAFGV